MPLRNVPRPLLLTFALTAVVGCESGGGTAPETEPPPPPPADVIQQVTVRVENVEILGSCDHDSLLEDSGDGEFSFLFEVTPSGSQALVIWSTGSRAFAEGGHDTGGHRATFNRNVTAGQDFALEFTATEYDGALGADGQFNGLFRTRSHQYQNGAWVGDQRSMELNAGKDRCGVRLDYSIASQTVS